MVRELLRLTSHIRITLKSTIPSYPTARPSRDLIVAEQAAEEHWKGDFIVTTQVPKPLSGDFTMQGLPETWEYCNQTGNLTAECAEGRGGGING